MDTSGVCMFVKDKSLVDAFARQFRGEGDDGARARKEYIALSVGFPPQTRRRSDGDGDGDGDSGTAAPHASSSSAAAAGSEFVVDAHIGAHETIPEARAVHPTPEGPAARPGDPNADATAPKHARTLCTVISASVAGGGHAHPSTLHIHAPPACLS